jgi:acyl-CoA dehydrogenase
VFGGYLIDRGGTPQQKAEILPALAAGELWAGAFTEPDAGSNVTNIKTFARKEGDRFLVKGQKVFISNMAVAKRIAVLCRTAPRDDKQRMAGISLLLGDLPNERIEYRPFRKMGTNYMDTNAVFFDDFPIPVENVVGEEGNAWRLLYKVLNPERLVISAINVGTGNYLIKKAVQYAQERSVWGAPLATHQGLQFPLAEARIGSEPLARDARPSDRGAVPRTPSAWPIGRHPGPLPTAVARGLAGLAPALVSAGKRRTEHCREHRSGGGSGSGRSGLRGESGPR